MERGVKRIFLQKFQKLRLGLGLKIENGNIEHWPLATLADVNIDRASHVRVSKVHFLFL